MRAELLLQSDYQVLSEAEQEALCYEIQAEVRQGLFKPAGEPSREHWNDVWSANLLDVPPPFMRPAQVLRVNGQFVQPRDPWLELHWYQRFRTKLLMDYFQDVSAIYEFGCGSGWNLLAAQQLWPLGKLLMGLDWAQPAVERLLSQDLGILARQFDFFHPDYHLKLVKGCGVWTVGALEQTGKDWEPFLEYLLVNKPAVCVHVEPILEWYDPENPVDATAIEYHLARNYWTGFPAKVDELARQGKVEVLEQKRSFFGSRYLEGYSLFCWRPV